MNFSKILGHERQVESLIRVIRSGRVGHSYLFSGPEGVGKRQVALAFAKALNCENFIGENAGNAGIADPCDRCGPCRSTEAGANPNILCVGPDEKGVLKIDSIRALQGLLRFRVEAGRRVCIVDGADTMVRAASSILLKTLEEPPAGSMLILVSSKPDRLLPTILSRCQRVNFTPLSLDALAGLVSEMYGIPGDRASAIAALSGGSLSRAERMAEPGAFEQRGIFLDKFKNFSSSDTVGLLDYAAELAKDEGLEQTLEYLKGWYRDLAVSAAGCRELTVDSKTGTGIGDIMDLDEFARSYELVEQARRDILPPRYGNKALTMETLFISLFGRG